MKNLNELAKLNYGLSQLIENEELDEQTIADSLEMLKYEVEAESNEIVAYHRNLDAEIKKNKEIAKQYTEYARKLELRKERLRKFITSYMNATNTEVIETDYAKISFRKSKSVEIDDETLLGDEYFVMKKEASKSKITEALKAGVDVQGARLIENRNLQIK